MYKSAKCICIFAEVKTTKKYFIMELKDYKFPKVSGLDMAFSTFDTTPELVEEAKSRNPRKGIEKFNELFFSGGKIELQDDVKGTWKEDAFLFARSLMCLP